MESMNLPRVIQISPWWVFFGSTILYTGLRIIYNVLLHPLKGFPGPLLARTTRLYFTYFRSTGQLEFKTKELHDRYGPVVRLSPDELSFNTGTAWDDIYGFKSNKRPGDKLIKDPHFYMGAIAPNGEKNLGASNDVDHSRIRGILSHAFSDRALHSQELMIKSHVDHLVLRLRSLANGPTDAVRWLHHTTFDIITDLAFGESANTLDLDSWSPEAHLMFEGLKEGITFVEILRYLPFKREVLAFFMWAAGAARRENFDRSVQKALRRLETGRTDTPDFMSYILRANGSAKEMTPSELAANAALLLDVGSETTASLLAGCLYNLAKQPEVLSRLTRLIRDTFPHGKDMDSRGLARIPYLTAVLEESLRMYPPIASSTPRVTPPGGCHIDGNLVAGNIIVAVNQYAMYKSQVNFEDPYTFSPDRWIGQEDGKRTGQFKHDKRHVLQPFSTGPRNCLGKNLAWVEMRLILGSLLWHFDVELTAGSEGWQERQKSWFIWDKPDLNLVFKPREL